MLANIGALAASNLYERANPDVRVGPSCPVCFNQREQVSKWWNRRGGYQAFIIREDVNGRRVLALVTRPSLNDGAPVVVQAGQYASYYCATLG